MNKDIALMDYASLKYSPSLIAASVLYLVYIPGGISVLLHTVIQTNNSFFPFLVSCSFFFLFLQIQLYSK